MTATSRLAVAGAGAATLALANLVEPAMGASSCNSILVSSLFYFGDLEKIADLGDLAAGLFVIGLDGLLADLAQAEGLSRRNVLLDTTADALDQLDL